MAWIAKETNAYGSMSESEMQNNALLQYGQLLAGGWTLNAIAGLMGNEERESYLNPGQWQGSTPVGTMSAGFGLVQWTPASKIIPWLGNDKLSGVKQTEAIMGLVANDWMPTTGYDLSYDEFKQSSQSPEWCALAFAYNYERAGTVAPEERQANARKWFNWLGGKEPPEPEPEPEGGTVKMKIWMYMKKI